MLAPAAGEAAAAVAVAAAAAAAAAVEDAGAAEAAFTLMMPLMVEEGASAPLELSRGGSQPKVSPRSSPGGSYPTPLALSSSLPLRPSLEKKFPTNPKLF